MQLLWLGLRGFASAADEQEEEEDEVLLSGLGMFAIPFSLLVPLSYAVRLFLVLSLALNAAS